MKRLLNSVLVLLVFGCGRLNFEHEPAVEGDASQCSLRIEPSTATVNLNSGITLLGSDGAAPFTYSVTDGNGTVQGSTGEYRSPGLPTVAEVTVTDDDGCVASATITASGSDLFIIGGRIDAGIASDEVWRSANGRDWSLVGRLPEPRFYGMAVVFNEQIWYLGGRSFDPTTTHTSIWVSDDGLTWTDVGDLDQPNIQAGAVIHKGQMWIAGGLTQAFKRSVDGVTWTTVGTLPINVHGMDLLVHDSRWMYLSGHDSSVFYPDVVVSDDGVTWETIGSLPGPREDAAALVIDGTIWVVGGKDSTQKFDDVLRSEDGVIWEPVSTLPGPLSHVEMTVWKGRTWVAGRDGSTTVLSSPDFETWESEATIPTNLDGFRMVQFTPAP